MMNNALAQFYSQGPVPVQQQPGNRDPNAGPSPSLHYSKPKQSQVLPGQLRIPGNGQNLPGKSFPDQSQSIPGQSQSSHVPQSILGQSPGHSHSQSTPGQSFPIPGQSVPSRSIARQSFPKSQSICGHEQPQPLPGQPHSNAGSVHMAIGETCGNGSQVFHGSDGWKQNCVNGGAVCTVAPCSSDACARVCDDCKVGAVSVEHMQQSVSGLGSVGSTPGLSSIESCLSSTPGDLSTTPGLGSIPATSGLASVSTCVGTTPAISSSYQINPNIISHVPAVTSTSSSVNVCAKFHSGTTPRLSIATCTCTCTSSSLVMVPLASGEAVLGADHSTANVTMDTSAIATEGTRPSRTLSMGRRDKSKCSEAVSEMDTVESGPRGEGKRGREGETGKGREETGVAASRNKKNKRQKVSSYGTTSTAASDLDKATMNLLQGRHSKGFLVEKSRVRFSDIGGNQKSLDEICKLLLHFQHLDVFWRLGVAPPQGILLHGPPGTGKSLLAQAIAGELNLPLIKLAATEVVSGISGDSEGSLRDLFNQAKSCAPCVLFIDEIDAISPRRETTQREMERRIVTQLLSCLDDLNQPTVYSSKESGEGSHGNGNNSPSQPGQSQLGLGGHVLVIGATNRLEALDPALRRAGRFDREISLGIPDEPARIQILNVLCCGLKLEEGFDFACLAHLCPGFVGADLLALCREASLCAVNRVLASGCGSMETDQGVAMDTDPSRKWSRKRLQHRPISEEQLSSMFITLGDFKTALLSVQPSAKREGFVTIPDVSWDDVGALEDIREELSMAILAPVRYPEQFERLGLTSPPGILLAGPPGCGKTLLAKAIANESGINFISVKGPELLNMYVGESERAVRQVFQRARNSSPCVIFFDELDALCPRRSDMAESSASARVVNQLLTEMDGLVARKQVYVMGATNRPDIIDPAVLRPGRLDKLLYVGLPSSKDRTSILNTITKSGSKPALDSTVDLSALASDDYTAGFSGADLSALVREAAVSALREHMRMVPQPPPSPPTLPHLHSPPPTLPSSSPPTLPHLHSPPSSPPPTLPHLHPPPPSPSHSHSHSQSHSLPNKHTLNSSVSSAPAVSSSSPSPSPSSPSPSNTDNSSRSCAVSWRHFMAALQKVKPSVSQNEEKTYKQLANQIL